MELKSVSDPGRDTDSDDDVEAIASNSSRSSTPIKEEPDLSIGSCEKKMRYASRLNNGIANLNRMCACTCGVFLCVHACIKGDQM